MLADWAGPLFAWTLSWLVWDQRCFAERELEGAEAVADWCGVLGADLRGTCGHEPCEGCDEFAGFVEVFELFGVWAVGEADLDCGCGHEVYRGGRDDFHGRNFCDVAEFLLGFCVLGVREAMHVLIRILIAHNAKLVIDHPAC